MDSSIVVSYMHVNVSFLVSVFYCCRSSRILASHAATRRAAAAAPHIHPDLTTAHKINSVLLLCSSEVRCKPLIPEIWSCEADNDQYIKMQDVVQDFVVYVLDIVVDVAVD